jgi:hypothetical protein
MRCREEQQDGGGVEQQGHDQDEVAHGPLVGATEQGREVAHGAEIGLDRLALAVHLGLLDAEISQRVLGRLALMDKRRPRRSLVANGGGLGVPLGGDGLGLVELGNTRLDVVQIGLPGALRASTAAVLRVTVSSPVSACSMWLRKP